MTYKSAISIFRSRYQRIALQNGRVMRNDVFIKSGLPKMTDREILMEMSVIQAELQTKYMLIDKTSQNNSTPQLTLTIGTDVYSAGSTAGTIPSDINQIWNITLNDNLKTELQAQGIEYMSDYVKPTGKPYHYCLIKQGSNQQLILDTLPDTAYLCNIYYCPSFDLYQGTGETSVTWSDVDFTASGYGGSLKIPDWENIIINGALSNATGDINILKKNQEEIEKMLQFQPNHSSGEIPYRDDGWNHSDGRRRYLMPGQDLPQYY